MSDFDKFPPVVLRPVVIGTALSECGRCGGAVTPSGYSIHAEWHDAVEAAARPGTGPLEQPANATSWGQLVAQLTEARQAFERASPDVHLHELADARLRECGRLTRENAEQRRELTSLGERLIQKGYELDQLIRVMMNAGYEGATPEARVEWLTATLANTGPYVWRPDGPPPPPYVRVLEDLDPPSHNGIRYLCRVGVGNDWTWLATPDRSHSGPAAQFEILTEGLKRPLFQVYGGDV